MKTKLLILAVSVVVALSGCTNQERVALGGIAGASGGMLAVDTQNRYMSGYGGYYGGGYYPRGIDTIQPRGVTPYTHPGYYGNY